MRPLDTGTLLRGRVIVTHYNLITAITITSRLTLLTLLTMTRWAKIYLFFPSDSLNIVFCIYWSEQQCWYSSFNLLRMLKYNQWWQEIIFILNKFPSLLFPQNAFIRTAEAAAKLVNISHGKVVGFIFVINLFDLNGSNNLKKQNYKVENLIEFPGH